MMRFILQFIRSLIVSPELLAICIFYALWSADLEFLSDFGLKLKEKDEVIKAALAFSGGAVLYVLQKMSSIRSPLESSNKVLYEWPGYEFLKVTLNVALLYVALSFSAYGYLYFYPDEFSSASYGAIFVAAGCVTAISAVSVWYACMDVKELLDRFA